MAPATDLPPIIDEAGLAALDAVLLADVRWYLDGADGHAAFVAGHRPGAVWVDLDSWLASPPTAADGRHPFPPAAVFGEGMRAIGLSDGQPLVAYDDREGVPASRLVWMLRLIGHPAALLDARWPPDRVESGEVRVEPGHFTTRSWPVDRLVDADHAGAAAASGGVVIDARAAARYRGETEPIDARAGHIPGAINLEFADNLVGGRFRSSSELAARFADVGDAPIVYCGSGVSACHNLLALESVGVRGRLYPGSWSQWSSDPSRDVATGPAD
ncbi:MAG: rhodanese-like domain-containing protein [Actinomycetota bacterium]